MSLVGKIQPVLSESCEGLEEIVPDPFLVVNAVRMSVILSAFIS